MAGRSKSSKQSLRLMKDFGKRLRAARIMCGYEQSSDDFAKEFGIKGQAYRKYERGESQPPFDFLAQLPTITGKTLDWFLLGTSP